MNPEEVCWDIAFSKERAQNNTKKMENNIVACRAISWQQLQTSSHNNSPRAAMEVLLEMGFSTVVRAEGL